VKVLSFFQVDPSSLVSLQQLDDVAAKIADFAEAHDIPGRCMYMYVYIYIYIYMCVCVSLALSVFLSISLSLCLSLSLDLSIQINLISIRNPGSVGNGYWALLRVLSCCLTKLRRKVLSMSLKYEPASEPLHISVK